MTSSEIMFFRDKILTNNIVDNILCTFFLVHSLPVNCDAVHHLRGVAHIIYDEFL